VTVVQPPMTAGRAGPRLNLLGDFQLLINGRNVSAPHGAQRLLALLGLAGRPVARSRVAGQLWADVPETRALGNLRSVVWRLGRIPRRIVEVIDDRLSLAGDVTVDIHELATLSRDMGRAPRDGLLERLPELMSATELLPGWEEDWIEAERGRFHELRLHALERACEAVLQRGDHSAAVQTAIAAIDAEPFRDSAQRLLLKAHLSEGNVAAALRAYEAYRDLVKAELGIAPSGSMQDLVAGLDRPGVAGRR
jgi:DNA-binding SARP family transcriptional activator